MKKILYIAIILMIILSISVNAASKITKDTKVTEPIKVEVDKVSFDENSLIGIYDEQGNVIGYYDRFDNNNSRVKSIRVYDLNKEHIYTISASDIDNAVYIISKDEKRAKIQIIPKIKGFKIQFSSEVQFYSKPYELAIFVDMGIRNASSNYIVTYESNPVIKETITLPLNKEFKKEIIVNKTFLIDNQNECLVWILSLFAIDELSSSQQNSSNGNNNSHFN